MFIEHADVAGVQPALGTHRFQAGLRVVEVAAHQVVATNQYLAGHVGRHAGAAAVDATDLNPGHGPAAGAGDPFGAVTGAADAGKAAGFGQAVGGDDGGKAQLLAHAPDHLHRDRGGTGDGDAQRTQVVVQALRVGQQ
ncbi:hypothetical protein D3C79_800730 [compost metagenome]